MYLLFCLKVFAWPVTYSYVFFCVCSVFAQSPAVLYPLRGIGWTFICTHWDQLERTFNFLGHEFYHYKKTGANLSHESNWWIQLLLGTNIRKTLMENWKKKWGSIFCLVCGLVHWHASHLFLSADNRGTLESSRGCSWLKLWKQQNPTFLTEIWALKAAEK